MFLSKAALTFRLASILIASGPSLVDASMIVTFREVGPDVFVDWSGSVNTSDLSIISSSAASVTGAVNPSRFVILGAPGFGDVAVYTGLTSPLPVIGPGAGVGASFGSGENFGYSRGPQGRGPESLALPEGYVSGQPINGSMTFSDSDFDSVGVTPGSYTLTWGSGADADMATINVIPEFSTTGALMVAFAAAVTRRKRRGEQAAAGQPATTPRVRD